MVVKVPESWVDVQAGNEEGALLEEEEEVVESDMEVQETTERPRKQRDKEMVDASEVPIRSKKPGARSSNKAESTAKSSTSSDSMPGLTPTPDELLLLTKRREKKAETEEKKKETKALTGTLADYPSLGHVWSEDPIFNMLGSTKSRLNSQMEVAGVDASRQRCGENRVPQGQVEEESPLVGQHDGYDGGQFVGPLGKSSTAVEEAGRNAEVPLSKKRHLQRGEVQRLKAGVARGKEVVLLMEVLLAASTTWTVLEVFAGEAGLTQAATQSPNWTPLDPVDYKYGQNLKTKEHRDQLTSLIDEQEPDLVTLSMPCGPWSSLTALAKDQDLIMQKQKESLPLWRCARGLWDQQVTAGRLVLSENPWSSAGRKLTFMEARPNPVSAKVAQCMFDLKDVASQKPHQKWTALDVNDEIFKTELEKGAHCVHRPEDHEQIQGNVKDKDGKWKRRSALASIWPPALCQHILKAAEVALRARAEKQVNVTYLALHEESPEGDFWETVPVICSQTPDEAMRTALSKFSCDGSRYDYITFDGPALTLPKKIRKTLAHIHVALGHLRNERLVSMCLNSGANESVIMGANSLRCMICNAVKPPDPTPQVAFKRPSFFNERVMADTLFRVGCERAKVCGIPHDGRFLRLPSWRLLRGCSGL